MSAFYLGLQSVADKLLADKGRPMTLRKLTPGAYNPATGQAVLSASDLPCVGATFPYAAVLIDGTRIKAGDQKLLLSAHGLVEAPDTSDKVLIDSVEYSVIEVQPVNPGGIVVMHKLRIRR